MKVIWLDEAVETFEQNIVFLSREWGDSVIEKFVAKTEQAIDLICKNPLAFPFSNKKKRIHKCVVVKQITLYYSVVGTEIHLLSFWNNYQNPKRLKL